MEQNSFINSSKIIKLCFLVISSATEPVPGWIDNFNGPIGLLVGGAKGILRVVYIDPTIVCDFFPVDVAIKLAIIVAWKRGIKTYDEDNTVHIYNGSSYDVKVMSMRNVIELGFNITKKEIPLDRILWSPNCSLTKSNSLYFWMTLFLHVLPALFIDGILKFFGVRPM